MKQYNIVIVMRNKHTNKVGATCTNDLTKRLYKYDLADFNLFHPITLPNPMDKLDALKFAKSNVGCQDVDVQEFINRKIGQKLTNSQMVKLILTTVKEDQNY